MVGPWELFSAKTCPGNLDVDRLFALIRRLAAQGMAVIYISHFLEEVREIATRYTVLRDGQSVDSGEITAASNEHLIAQLVGRPIRMASRADEPPGPLEAVLGNVDDGVPREKLWMEPVTENPLVGATEVWEMYNTTGDAHPMHVHEVTFEVVNREGLVLDGEEVAEPIQLDGNVTLPEPWESGVKDTVIAYPGQVTRIRAQFNTPGQFVWHCHIVEHEDNEMMRPYFVGPNPPTP